MNKNQTLVSLAIFTALYSPQSMADLRDQCLMGVPHFTGEVVQGDLNTLPVYIEADDAEINQPTQAVYQGNVDVRQGNRHLMADSVEVKQSGNHQAPQRFAYIRGGFDYKDNQLNMLGKNADFNLDSHDGHATNADYELVGRQGRGKAEHINLQNDYRVMKNATFTSCLRGDNAWAVDASEIRQYVKEEYAEMWHARFKVHGVPVFYTPYLQLPIGDRRRSGLLIPSGGSSSRDGFWYMQPIYWNIAPNYDMTVTPKYMSHRGWQLNGEFRYLTSIGEGKVAGEYLGRDRYDEYISDKRQRHLFYWNHSSSFLENWRFNVNYTRVSDKRYFNDFDSQYGSSTDGYADQYARIAYYKPNYNFSLSARQFQVFDENLSIGPYRAMPQMDFNYYKHDLANGWLDFKWYSQAVRFDNDSDLMPTAWRFHIEPSLSSSMSNEYGGLKVETKLYGTRYEQKKGSGVNAEEVQKNINRVIPQFKLDLQTVLARDTTVLKDYTQTFEPHIQYLYRPYRDQSNIGSKQRTSDYLGFGYDSALVQQDYYSLFRDRRYSGLDRISSANQMTLGGTTRFYDKTGDERFNLSAGQIYYLNDSRIDDNPANKTPTSSSSWALESNWKMSDHWRWRGSYQYDTNTHATSLANTSLEYNPEKDNLIQLNYRYASQNYIDQNLGRSANAYRQDIQQIGLVTAWEVSDNWSVVGKYYHDLALKKPVEQYLGIQYNTCCWAAGIGARRYVTSRQHQDEDSVLYDHGIGFTLELRGLGTNNYQNGIDDMLEKGKLPYIRAFSLE